MNCNCMYVIAIAIACKARKGGEDMIRFTINTHTHTKI
jgi:hypothetical protein